MISKTSNFFYCIKLLLSTLLVCFVAFGCIPATEETLDYVDINQTDPEFQKLYDLIDQRKTDSVLLYTSHSDPAMRYLVANAMASMQSPESMDSLIKLMEDPVMKVRSTAAYALGQLGKKQAVSPLLSAFRNKDTIDVDNWLNASILEAVGRIGDEGMLRSVATISTYRKTDTLLLTHQALSIYRFALRGITSTEGTDHMIATLANRELPGNIHRIAAAYLQRSKDVDLTDFAKRLTQIYVDSTDPFIKMRLPGPIAKTMDLEALGYFISDLKTKETDYRVKVEILKALTNYPYIQGIDAVIEQLGADNLHVAHTAADYLISHGNGSDASLYKTFITPDMRWSIKAKIYQAILKHMPLYFRNTKRNITTEIKALYDTAESPTQQAMYMDAIGQDPYNYLIVQELGGQATHPLLKSTSVRLLGDILRNPNTIQAFKGGITKVKSDIIAYIRKLMTSGDLGAIAEGGNILTDEELALSPYVMDSLEAYQAILSNIKLPQGIESYNALGKAIAAAQGKRFEEKVVDFNHPIAWNIFNTWGDSTIAVMKTNKGNITIKLDMEAAPATAANFITLAQQDYYDNKSIHRVVPNFVIQGGCDRGDGYGGPPYTIRSEFTQKYYDDEGYVGMASAGRDTEGSQWFITHSPTPHLDGRYTIFGKVIRGMDVVHMIQAGDITHDVIISRL